MKVFYTALMVLILASCAPKTLVTTPIQALAKDENLVVNSELNIIAFPRSVIYVNDSEGIRTHLEFATPIQIKTVYSFFDTQLNAKGWKRQSERFVERFNTYEASYLKQSQRLELSLNQNSDRYTLDTH
jgi:hypothetical protein